MLETGEIIAFAASADLRQARDFYEQVLGLRVIEQNDFACVFDANGTMLRVTAVAQVARPGYTVLGWRVADIAATVHGLTERGVVFLRYDGMDQDETGLDDPGRRQDRLVHRSRRERPLAHPVRVLTGGIASIFRPGNAARRDRSARARDAAAERGAEIARSDPKHGAVQSRWCRRQNPPSQASCG